MAPEPNPIGPLAAELGEQLSPDEFDLITTYALRLWLRGDEVGLDVLRRAQGGDAGAAEALAAELLDLADELGPDLYRRHLLDLADELDEQS